MLLMERLLERLLPWKVMMLVCLRDGIIREGCSSGDKMADQGRSLVPPAGPETDTLQEMNIVLITEHHTGNNQS